VFASAVTVGICQLIPCSVLAYRATAAGSADTSDDADGSDDAVRAK
jgi:hypothetical protein